MCVELPWDLILGASGLAATLGYLLGMEYMVRKWMRAQESDKP